MAPLEKMRSCWGIDFRRASEALPRLAKMMLAAAPQLSSQATSGHLLGHSKRASRLQSSASWADTQACIGKLVS